VEKLVPPTRCAPRFDIERELVGYALADVVTVPARHVAESFRERGFPESRVFVNPFGVSTEVFTRLPLQQKPGRPFSRRVRGRCSKG
jgi:hypothetical protein